MSEKLTHVSDDELLQELASRVRATGLRKAGSSNLIYALFDAVFDSFESIVRASLNVFDLVVRRTAGKIEKIVTDFLKKHFGDEGF